MIEPEPKPGPKAQKKDDDLAHAGCSCIIIIIFISCFYVYGVPFIKAVFNTSVSIFKYYTETPEPVPVIGGPPITDYKGQKWEYKNIIVPSQNLSGFKDQENTYTSLGNQGWEYAGFIDKPPQPYIIFKRPVSK